MLDYNSNDFDINSIVLSVSWENYQTNKLIYYLHYNLKKKKLSINWIILLYISHKIAFFSFYVYNYG